MKKIDKKSWVGVHTDPSKEKVQSWKVVVWGLTFYVLLMHILLEKT